MGETGGCRCEPNVPKREPPPPIMLCLRTLLATGFRTTTGTGAGGGGAAEAFIVCFKLRYKRTSRSVVYTRLVELHPLLVVCFLSEIQQAQNKRYSEPFCSVQAACARAHSSAVARCLPLMPDGKRWDSAAGAFVPLTHSAPPARRFTAQELRAFDGTADAPIYVCIGGIVFDVTPEARLYGPGGAYCNLAGRDASSALAQSNMGAEAIAKGWRPDYSDLELDRLAKWVDTFRVKYEKVGTLAGSGNKHDRSSNSHL